MNRTPHEKEEDLSPVSPPLSPTGDLSADPLSVHPRRNTLRKLSLTHHNGQVCLLRINAPSTRTPILNRLPLSPEQSHPGLTSIKSIACLNKAVILENTHLPKPIYVKAKTEHESEANPKGNTQPKNLQPKKTNNARKLWIPNVHFH
jgi:hypothetical protein